MKIDDFTFVITTYLSDKIIDECLKDLPGVCRKIVIDNSGNKKMKKRIEEKYINVECLLMDENLGYGKANNVGIKNSNTEYIFILNPDAKLTEEKFLEIIKKINSKDFAIAAPQIREKNNIYKQNFTTEDILFVDQVPGMALILNKEKFNNNFFDENFFLYLEEIDLCRRMKKQGENIIEVNVELEHLGGKSHGEQYEEVSKSRNWHWMWSKFYFNKKYNGYFYAFIITFPTLAGSFLKYIFFKLINNYEKKIKYKMRFLGLFNGYILRGSFYRPCK